MDAGRRTVHVTSLAGVAIYAAGDSIPVTVFDGGRLPAEAIFAI